VQKALQRFLDPRCRSRDGNPYLLLAGGGHHRELTVYSFDSERETIVMRAFIVEGYVLRYTCEVGPQRIVCNTESVEGGAGMRARETIEIADGYRFEETFELASPGQELKVFFTNSWTRVPDLDD
jgi:hypothetical protein